MRMWPCSAIMVLRAFISEAYDGGEVARDEHSLREAWAAEALDQAMALVLGGDSNNNNNGGDNNVGNETATSSPTPTALPTPVVTLLSPEIKAGRLLVTATVERSRKVFGALYAALPEGLCSHRRAISPLAGRMDSGIGWRPSSRAQRRIALASCWDSGRRCDKWMDRHSTPTAPMSTSSTRCWNTRRRSRRCVCTHTRCWIACCLGTRRRCWH